MIPWPAYLLAFAAVFCPLAAAAVCAGKLWRAWRRRRSKLEDPPRWFERPRAWVTSAVFLLLFTGGAFYSWKIEPNWLEVTYTELPVSGPILGHDRFRIVHLSDLHLEELGAREREVLEAVRRAGPHLIVLTGDYMNARGAQGPFATFLQVLRDVKPMHGIYGVGGNWDGKFPVKELFEASEARYLQDDYHRPPPRFGRNLLIVGQDYYPVRSLGQLLEGAPEESFRLLLHHSPDAVEQLSQGRIDLFLCGHTHGGQVRLPLYGAVVTLTKQHKRFEQGLYTVLPPESVNPAGTPMYVSRGIGMSGGALPRIRFLARPEVAIIDLVSR